MEADHHLLASQHNDTFFSWKHHEVLLWFSQQKEADGVPVGSLGWGEQSGRDGIERSGVRGGGKGKRETRKEENPLVVWSTELVGTENHQRATWDSQSVTRQSLDFQIKCLRSIKTQWQFSGPEVQTRQNHFSQGETASQDINTVSSFPLHCHFDITSWSGTPASCVPASYPASSWIADHTSKADTKPENRIRR